MHDHWFRAAILGVFAAALAGQADAQTLKVYDSKDARLALGQFAFPGGKTLNLTVGIGSGAFRHPSDPAMEIYTVSDRGPNIACADAEGIAGLKPAAICAKAPGGRLYPLPDYAPAIHRVGLDPNDTFRILDIIPLKDRDGRPVNGLTNPLTVASTEISMDGMGNILPQDASAVDAEGIVKLTDGTFWIGDENGPSLMHVGADGRILRRHVPIGTEKDYTAARYEVVGTLPAILAKRQSNRGIESMAISPDERFLYFIVQNPLANPDAKAYQTAKNTRLYKLERATMTLVGEYVYTLDDPQSFRLDPSPRQNDPRISELLALGTDRLIVLERTEGTTKLHEISLAGATDILGTPWDDMKTAPSLEQLTATDAKITPVSKTLRFDSADHKDVVPVKAEGLAMLGDGSLVMINDDDFGITGGSTRIVVVSGSQIRADR